MDENNNQNANPDVSNSNPTENQQQQYQDPNQQQQQYQQQQYQQQQYQQQPYQQPPVQPNGYYPGEQKSKIAAGILGILVGALGVHNFYLGYTGKAVAQLLLTLCTCGLASPATYIWGLVEGILILTGSTAVDARGIPLKD